MSYTNSNRDELIGVLSPQPWIWICAALLALLPAISFALQWWFSVQNDRTDHFFTHTSVVLTDWLLIPFNFFAVRCIDWRRGGIIFCLGAIACLLNVIVHAFWQGTGTDPGHMITTRGVITSAGWTHLVFSIVETTVVGAFIFAQMPKSSCSPCATIFGISYFIGAGISGYLIHNRVIFADALLVVVGILLLVLYPRLKNQIV